MHQAYFSLKKPEKRVFQVVRSPLEYPKTLQWKETCYYVTLSAHSLRSRADVMHLRQNGEPVLRSTEQV